MPDRFGHFDADVYRAAQEEPTLTLGGLLYRGRLLDIEEWLGYAEEHDRLREQGAPQREVIQFYRRYLRAVFPRRRYRWWAADPVPALLAMPWGVVMEATARFFALQVRASTPSAGQPSETPGTSSPTSTTAAPASDAVSPA